MRREGLAQSAIRAGIPLLAALYSRVSQDKNDDHRSVEDQDAENREACADAGWQVSASYCDNDRSASRFATKERENWDRLLEDLAGSRFHVLVLWESSRGDRRLARWIYFLDLCRELGVLIHITSHERTYDVRKRRDYKTLAEEGLDSADDSEKTSERVSRTVKATARKGLPHGRSLYGYRRIYDVDSKGRKQLVKVIPDDEPRETVDTDGNTVTYSPAGLVQEIFARFSSGDAMRNITADLNRRGIPSPRNSKHGWSVSRVREIVTNPAYIGQRVFQGRVLEGVKAVWPPLVDHVTFRSCARIVQRQKEEHSSEGAVRRLLSGLAVCGVCGRTVRRMGSASDPKYVCSPGNVKGVGYCVSRSIADVDDYVSWSICFRLSRADLAELLAGDREADEVEARLEAEITEKEHRLGEARDAYAAGRLPLASLERIESSLGPEIERAKGQLRTSRIAPVIAGLVGADAAEIEAEWKRRSISQRREIIRLLTSMVEIMPVGPGRSVYKPEESVRITWRRP